ncbi:unnamed protein product [Closterium sp. NIES-64]|nr:unnamed protein product [Closterium sp. NIES-64]
MPLKGKPAKPAARMDPVVAAVPAVPTTPAPVVTRPVSLTAVPPKSTRALFAEEEASALTLSAKLAAIRIEQAAGGEKEADNGKKKDAVFKDAVSNDPGGDPADEDEGEASGSGPSYAFLNDDDDGLIAHDPNEGFEDKAKGELAAKLKFPLTLLVHNEHMQELPFMEATVKGLLVLSKLDLTENAAVTTECQELTPAYLSKKLFGRLQVTYERLLQGPGAAAEAAAAPGAAAAGAAAPGAAAAATVASVATKIILKDPTLVLASTAGNREEWVCLLECCEKGKGSSFEQAAHHALSQRHRGGLTKPGVATRALKDKLSLRVLKKEYGLGRYLLAGDLNLVEDPVLDKSSGAGSSGENDRLLRMFSSLHMVDAYRALNLGGQERTFYSRVQRASSRIDRILVSAELLPSVAEASHPRPLKGISDHKFGVKVVLQASLRLHMGPGLWSMPTVDTSKPGAERVI